MRILPYFLYFDSMVKHSSEHRHKSFILSSCFSAFFPFGHCPGESFSHEYTSDLHNFAVI